MEFTLKRGQIRAMLHLAATKDVRYYLNGLHVVTDERGTIIEATDGHLLGMLRVDEQPKPAAKVILGTDELKPLLAGGRRNGGDVVEFYVADGVVKAATIGATITFKAVDGVFPNTQRVTPTNKVLEETPDEPVSINPSLLIRFAAASKDLDGSDYVYVRQRKTGTCLVDIGLSQFVGVVMAMRDTGDKITVPWWVHGMPKAEAVEQQVEEVTA